MPRITIYHGTDRDRLAELRNEVSVAERALELAEEEAKGGSQRFGDGDPEGLATKRAKVQECRDAFDAFVDEAAERADEWVIEPIGHEEWRELLRSHPPRMVPKADGTGERVHEDDEGLGVNAETFGKALLLFADPEDDEHRTVTSIGGSVPTDLGKRLRRLSYGQFETLWIAAYQANAGGIADPKLARYSLGAPRSDET